MYQALSQRTLFLLSSIFCAGIVAGAEPLQAPPAPFNDGAVNFQRNTSGKSLKTSDSFGGVNFWQNDRLHIPDYRKCRNLAPNPSFESGLRYYTFYGNFKEKNRQLYSIDNTISKFGNCSLKISAVKDLRTWGNDLQTFAIPSIPENKYTVSFYAKGDKKSGLHITQNCISGVWMQFPKAPTFSVSDEWKRFSYTVTAPNNVLTFLMSPHGEGNIWVDGLQIEEGETATDYVEKPLYAELLTSSPDNFLSVNDKEINARLKITAPPNTAGSAECALEDFFYNTAWKQTINFKTDEKGVALVGLPLDKALGTGVYVLRADFTLKDGYKDSDYFRISRMKFLNNTHKNKNICGTAIGPKARTEDFLKRARDIGIGSARSVGKAKEFSALEAQYGITVVLEYFLWGGKLLTVDGIFKDRKSFSEIEKLPEGAEKRIEEAAYEMVKAYPWIDRWCLMSEMDGTKLVSSNIKDFARTQMACYKAVKRFDPNKKFFLGGSCNMEPRNGTMQVDKYLEAVKELDPDFKFDGVTIHPYRTTPENPDLDDDAAAFFAMLDKYGYQNIPAYWDEGIYYPRYNIPAWGLDPHRGCSSDHYRAGCPSYHMGWGERISAAYNARAWLVALKYQDRVKMFVDAEFGDMDAYLAPMAVQKIPNTLGNLLGNASFKKDIRFAPEMRCYVFEDENKRPVAALWSHNPNVDRGFEPSPKAAFNFKGVNAEFIDLMENPRSVNMDKDGNCEIPVTPFPLFIRGGAGELDKFCAAIQNARALNASKLPLQISAKPVSASELEISLVNLVTRDFNGKVALNIGGKTIEKDLALKGKGSQKIVVPLSVKIPADKIAEIKLPLELTETGFKPVKTDLTFTAFTVKKLSGTVPDWKNIPSIKMTNRSIYKATGGCSTIEITEKVGYPGDFEAEYQMAWNDENLYLRVNITDDVFYHNANKDVGARCDNDSLQIYIDTLCDARSKETKGYDGNDYNYDFYPNMMKDSTSEPDGTITAFRRTCPEQQLIGGLFAVQPNTVEPEIKGSFKKTDKGYAYEVVMPKRLIAPVELRSGSVSGFAMYLPDHDGKCVKGALSTTSAPGTGGWRNPHLYPVMLLIE